MKMKIRELIGSIPIESGFKRRMRFHQGWWRSVVLAEIQGSHPTKNTDSICNTILNGEINHKNFLSESALLAISQTLEERSTSSSGIIEIDRLYNNLLSSQPLCFNFFGEFKRHTSLALSILKTYWPDIDAVTRVIFEFSPVGRYTNDNSAFDVAFEVLSGNRTGIIGLECKYTDTFSAKEYDRPEYREIYTLGKSDLFIDEYEKFKSSKYNQLFRNQLIAASVVQHADYDFAYTGLFCHPDDESAIQTGMEFSKMLKNGDNIFRTITYTNIIEAMQKQNLTWSQRELSMLLWARYCGQILSNNSYE
jgi:hypothetical protein